MARPRTFHGGRVVDGAMHEFWRNGFNATAVERLCAVMELSPGSLYGAFGGKRELFIAALDRYMDQISSDAIRRSSGACVRYGGNSRLLLAPDRRDRGRTTGARMFPHKLAHRAWAERPRGLRQDRHQPGEIGRRVRIGTHQSECRRRNRSRAGCEVGRLSCLLGAGAQCSGKYEAQPRFP